MNAAKSTGIKALVPILTVGVFGILNTEMGIVGLIPYVVERFGVTVPDAGLLVSVFALIVAIAGPTMPLLFSRMNRRTVMLLALGVFTVCNTVADFCETVEVTPAVNQVELHPFFSQEAALATMREYGVVPEAWGPFAEGNHGIFTHPVLTAIGEKYGKTAAQVALRWNIQRGVVVIPKSVHRDRMEQNIDVWDFELTADDMAQIAELTFDHSEIVNHDDPAFVKMLHGVSSVRTRL